MKYCVAIHQYIEMNIPDVTAEDEGRAITVVDMIVTVVLNTTRQ